MSNEPDEDLIEATIRRVAASKAARRPEPTEDQTNEASTSDPELHLVEAAGDDTPAPPAPRSAPDESLIEATLRRIEAQQAERTAAAAEKTPAAEAALAVAPDPTPRVVPAVARQTEREPARPSVPELHLVPSDPQDQDARWRDIDELRRDLDEALRQIGELRQRVDALGTPASEPRRAAPTPVRQRAQASGASEDDWDDAPLIARVDSGMPPRPAIIRDPAPVASAATTETPSTPGPQHPSPAAEPKRGFDLLPRTYRITVEDKRRGVDLVPLHRALLGMEGVRDMSLLSYSNGTAIVALEATTEILPDALAAAVAHAMAREVKVEVHNEQTMVLKLAED